MTRTSSENGTLPAARENTPKRVAMLLGVARETVRNWFGDATNGRKANGCEAPDARIKIAPQHKSLILDRIEAGESQAQVAADYGVRQQAGCQPVASITTRTVGAVQCGDTFSRPARFRSSRSLHSLRIARQPAAICAAVGRYATVTRSRVRFINSMIGA
jgi:hypothetical protein